MKNQHKALALRVNSIRVRVLAMLIGVNVVIIGLFAVASYFIFEKTLVREVGTTRSDVLSQIGERVKVVKNNAYTLSNLYYYDENLTQYLEQDNTQISAPFLKYLDMTTQQYKTAFLQAGIEYSMVLSLENGGGYCSEPVPAQYDYMRPKIKIWYKEMYQGRGKMVDIASYKDKLLGTSSFCVARSIINRYGEPLAYLMINIDERQIYEMYKNVTDENSNIYIVDQSGTIVSSNIQKLRGFNFFSMPNLDKLFGKDDYTVTEISGRTVLFTKYYDAASGFTVLEEIPLRELLRSLDRVRAILIAVTVFAVLAACIWAWRFASRTIGPIQELSNFMTTVEADRIHANCEVQGYTEINNLRQGLNGMLERIRNLVASEKQKERQKREMELSFLQAQINPHFMYNTLFSVKCMVDMGENEKAAKMLTAFITLLRSTLSSPQEFITIGNEFDVLSQFAEILRFRYTNSLEIILECSDEVRNKKIPKLLIQPLMENAVFHGVESKGGQGMVTIVARLCGSDVVITVEDDGAGMSPETLARLKEGSLTSKSSHIGVMNVKERIQLYFGEEYGMHIESNPDIGTKVVLTFPAIE